MRGRLLLVFLLSLLLFLMVNMPVVQLFRFSAPPPDVGIEGLEGSLLAGRVRRLTLRGLAFEDVEYRLRPLCLLRLALCYRLESDAGDLLLQLSASPWSGIGIEDSRVTLPLPQLTALAPTLLVRPTGELELVVDQAGLDQGRLTGLKATAYWREAGIEGEKLKLGDFRADAERSDQGLDVRFSDLPGSLVGVDGSLRLGERDYRLDLKLEARPGLADSVRSALELLARKNGLNRYRVQQQGQLPRPLPLLAAEDPGQS